MQEKKLALVKKGDLSLVQDNVLNEKQLQLLLRTTPNEYIRQRPAKGGGTWDYVSVGYITKVLNLMFGWDWDFEIVKDNSDMVLMGTADEVVVLGKLTCRCGDRAISKMQFGNKDVVFKNNYIDDGSGGKKKVKTTNPLSIGNDLKAAASDALKKCASAIGIAADIYNKQEFKAVKVDSEEPTQDTEILRVTAWIDKADSIIKLEECKVFVEENATEENGLRKLYDDKEKEL